MNMFPQSPRSDCVNRDCFHAEKFAERCWAKRGVENFYYLQLRQFGIRVPFTLGGAEKLLSRYLSAIFGSVVVFVAIRVFGSRLPSSFVGAKSASSGFSTSSSNQIFSRQGMTLFAMGHPATSRSEGLAAHCVYVLSYRLKMFWIDARPISAEVVYDQTFRYRPDAEQITQTMGHHFYPTAPPAVHAAVPVFAEIARVWPALILRVCSLEVPKNAFEWEVFHA